MVVTCFLVRDHNTKKNNKGMPQVHQVLALAARPTVEISKFRPAWTQMQGTEGFEKLGIAILVWGKYLTIRHLDPQGLASTKVSLALGTRRAMKLGPLYRALR